MDKRFVEGLLRNLRTSAQHVDDTYGDREALDMLFFDIDCLEDYLKRAIKDPNAEPKEV